MEKRCWRVVDIHGQRGEVCVQKWLIWTSEGVMPGAQYKLLIASWYFRYVELQRLLRSLKKPYNQRKRMTFHLLENFSSVLFGNDKERRNFPVQKRSAWEKHGHKTFVSNSEMCVDWDVSALLEMGEALFTLNRSAWKTCVRGLGEKLEAYSVQIKEDSFSLLKGRIRRKKAFS